MSTPLKIQRGAIHLPKELKKDWQESEIQIREYGHDRIVIERTIPAKKRNALEAWKQAAGILKERVPDPISWQRKIRKEWDRKLPRFHVHR